MESTLQPTPTTQFDYRSRHVRFARCVLRVYILCSISSAMCSAIHIPCVCHVFHRNLAVCPVRFTAFRKAGGRVLSRAQPVPRHYTETESNQLISLIYFSYTIVYRSVWSTRSHRKLFVLILPIQMWKKQTNCIHEFELKSAQS